MDKFTQVKANKAWSAARRKAFWTQIRAYVTSNDEHLPDFDDLSHRLGLRNQRYRGLQEIPLDKIAGSVGRYHDFVATFLPTTSQMKERWQGVAQMFVASTVGGRQVPPIEAYKVGALYFVKDGNHRVSVAHQMGLVSLDAYVWEYQLATDVEDLDALLIEAERRDFLACTHLEQLCPQLDIHLTEPGGYQDLLAEIIRYHQALTVIDRDEAGEIGFSEAVVSFFEMVFEPSVMIIEREGALETFPERTPADLFVFTRRYLRELDRRYQGQARLTLAVHSLQDDAQVSFLQRVTRKIFRHGE